MHRGRSRGVRGPNFVVLWIIVSGLWTVATVMRIQRAWAPVPGWPAVLGNPLAWVSLFMPPLMFAIILLAMKRIATERQRGWARRAWRDNRGRRGT
jgi:hypothetical protein